VAPSSLKQSQFLSNQWQASRERESLGGNNSVESKLEKQPAQVVQTFNASRYPALRAIVDSGKEPVQSLADMVGERILTQVISNELQAGTPLTTNGVAKSLGVSRTPVAKAFSKLAAEGILEQPSNQNAVVRMDACTWLQQSRELRTILEPEAAARAAGNISPEVLSDLWALSREAKPDTSFDWTPVAEFFDAALHLAIAEFCGNVQMKLAIQRCWTYKRLAYLINPCSKAELKADYEQHVAILTALSNGDGELAWKAMLTHLKAAGRDRQHLGARQTYRSETTMG
jgi:DNA-binding GntR family transcriptional regulator